MYGFWCITNQVYFIWLLLRKSSPVFFIHNSSCILKAIFTPLYCRIIGQVMFFTCVILQIK